MATDVEEFEASIMLVCSAYKELRKINPDNPLLSLIKLEEVGFVHTPEYHKRYVSHLLRSTNGQLCLWDWAYPNQIEAKISGLITYERDLSAALQTKISERNRHPDNRVQ